jgi:hypothetical protein
MKGVTPTPAEPTPAMEGGEEKLTATEVTIGRGLVDIGPIYWLGKTGVLIRARPNHIAFGEPGELQKGEYDTAPGDVVIWVDGSPDVLIRELAALRPSPPAPEGEFKCGARSGSFEPQDCDWPYCGCDPKATKVIAALEEQGWARPSAPSVEEVKGVLEVLTKRIERAKRIESISLEIDVTVAERIAAVLSHPKEP